VNSPDADILLLGDDIAAGQLRAMMNGRGLAHHTQAYPALEEMSRRAFDTVLLMHPQADFTSLVRAVRRLGRSARTIALCGPGGEADLQIAHPGLVDDYFIYPPTPDDVARILGRAPVPAAGSDRAAPDAAAGVGSADLTAGELAALVESAANVETLEKHVARQVREFIGLDVRWISAADNDSPGAPLLLLDADPPRVLLADSAGAGQLAAAAQAKLHAFQALLAPLAAQARRTEKLHRLAITDDLTGAFNRRYFYHYTDRLLARAKSERFRATLLLYDIDDFKRYNDAYGHAAGDEILRDTAALMRQTTRDQDVVARIGGDEFTVLFWDAEPPRKPDSQHPDSAYDLATRFVKALADHEFPSLGAEAKGVLTISGGLASFPWDGQTCRDLLRHADAALRQAKAAGKNAIHLIGPGQTGPKA